MDVIAAYRDVGSFRGAADLCGVTHKTVRRIVEAYEAGQRPARQARARNFDLVADLVAERVAKTSGRISAKRLLPQAQAAGYARSARNFRWLGSDPISARRPIRSRRGWWSIWSVMPSGT